MFKDYVSVPKAAEMLGLSIQIVRSLIDHGEIQTFVTPGGRKYCDVKAYMAKLKERGYGNKENDRVSADV
jgi:predicted site-specific integrase-resolvase